MAAPPADRPDEPRGESPTRVRYGVLAFLCAMSFVLYLDRICIAQAEQDIREALGLTKTQMGYVLGAFTVAYGLFEVPTGHWGDRHGSRSVLVRIVVWWSIFTMLTGAAFGFGMLVVVRFLFGAGEAGALPNAARVTTRWFPAGARGPAQGTVVASALVGGALSPIVAQQLIATFGWRGAFAALGVPGIAWAVAFWLWFRDDPAAHPGTNAAERELIAANRSTASGTGQAPHAAVPWRYVLAQPNLWLLGTTITCSAFTTYLFFSWYPTYLKSSRGLDPVEASRWASLVLGGGAVGSLGGGWLSDFLVRRMGDRRRSRRTIGLVTLSSAAVAMACVPSCDETAAAAGCATWACFAVHLHLGAWWGVVTEVSGHHVGALFGLLNSLGVPGAVSSQLFLGRFADWMATRGHTGRAQWDPAFYIYAAGLAVGACCWLGIDATCSLVEPCDAPDAADESDSAAKSVAEAGTV